jgi:hypothetical protein
LWLAFQFDFTWILQTYDNGFDDWVIVYSY